MSGVRIPHCPQLRDADRRLFYFKRLAQRFKSVPLAGQDVGARSIPQPHLQKPESKDLSFFCYHLTPNSSPDRRGKISQMFKHAGQDVVARLIPQPHLQKPESKDLSFFYFSPHPTHLTA